MFRLSSTTLLALLTATATSVVSQSIPQANVFPAACATQCSATIRSSVLCFQQYTTGPDIVSCFCSGIPSESDVSTCSSCLSSNGASELSGVLSAVPSACSTYSKTCSKECGFNTCPSTDVACQCSESYLANIYQCASCNTRNNNVGATQVSDYESLANSCGNQNYTVPATSSSALPSPTGQATYTAPTLAASASSYSAGATTITGFEISTEGGASTVAVSTSESVRASSVRASSVPSTPVPSTGAGAATIATGSASHSRSAAASAASSTGSRTASASAAASAAPTSGAMAGVSVNAVGVVGALFAAVALF